MALLGIEARMGFGEEWRVRMADNPGAHGARFDDETEAREYAESWAKTAEVLPVEMQLRSPWRPVEGEDRHGA